MPLECFVTLNELTEVRFRVIPDKY